MAKITKPDMSIQWAQTGTISVPSDGKKQSGWAQEKPPFEYMNWLQNRQDTAIAYSYQFGIPEWDNTTEYQYASGYSSFVQYNGVVYKCIQTGTNKNPSTQTAYWQQAFDSYGAAATVNTALNTHITNYGTLAGLTNKSTARNNLSVYSQSECLSYFAPKAGDNYQTFLVATATNPNHAVTLAQLAAATGGAGPSNSSETTVGLTRYSTSAETLAATIDTAAVTPAKLGYFFNNKTATTSSVGVSRYATTSDTITGTDNNSTVTPYTLEQLFSYSGRKLHNSNGYQKLPGGLIIQWGYWSGITNAAFNNTVTFPTPFSTACFHVSGSMAQGNGYGPYFNPAALSTSSFQFGVVDNAGNVSSLSTSIYWFAIGY